MNCLRSLGCVSGPFIALKGLSLSKIRRFTNRYFLVAISLSNFAHSSISFSILRFQLMLLHMAELLEVERVLFQTRHFRGASLENY